MAKHILPKLFNLIDGIVLGATGCSADIAGENFVVIASDTCLTDGGYGILSRGQPKLFNLTDGIVLGAIQELTCTDCGKLFKSKRSLFGHRKEKHSGVLNVEKLLDEKVIYR